MRGLFAGILLPCIVAMTHANPGLHRAWIEHVYDAGRLSIMPHVAAGHTAGLRYELVFTKSDTRGNASNTRQAGKMELGPGEVRSLSRLRLSINQGDQFTLKLRVYENDQLVAEDVVTYPE